MRKSYFLAAVLAHCIICSNPVSALPKWLVARQFCDTIACLPDDWWVGPTGLVEGINEWFDGFMTNPIPEISPNIPKDGRQIVPAPPILEPDIDLEVIAPNQGPEECLPSSPPDSQGSSDGTNPRPCVKATEQLIWPVSCEDTAQNGKTQQMLSVMDVGYRAIVDHMCQVKDGVLFWLAELKPEEIDLLKNGGGVGSIVPNLPFRSEVISTAPAEGTVPANRKRSTVKKRATLNVVKQETNDPSLAFLSSPPWKKNSNAYAYLSHAGEGVRVYNIDAGFNAFEGEFGGLEVSWIYPPGSPREEKEDSQVDKGYLPGTCLVSKIAGRQFGVAKKPKLTIVKVKPTIASFMEALMLVFVDLQSLSVTKGWTVVNIAGGFKPSDEPLVDWEQTLERMRILLVNGIVELHGTVVVCSSGADFVKSYSDMTHYPARIPGIITVGSVLASNQPQPSGDAVDGLRNGQRFPWSRGRDSVTLNAPGNAHCLYPDNQVRLVLAPSLSSAIVTGLVAYFLSLPDLGPYFRQQRDTPAVVTAYLQRFSYKRFQLQESVWNGLDSEQTTLQYDRWYGNAPSKQLNPQDMRE
ncbi:hypothetical protein MMC31_008217 [Peltigera leucophlebia]|nr:hypothetical protein [Peltigera leucophlebia]